MYCNEFLMKHKIKDSIAKDIIIDAWNEAQASERANTVKMIKAYITDLEKRFQIQPQTDYMRQNCYSQEMVHYLRGYVVANNEHNSMLSSSIGDLNEILRKLS